MFWWKLIWLNLLFLAAKDMHIFMMKWYEKFPEFKSRELFLTGESYAGLPLEWGFNSGFVIIVKGNLFANLFSILGFYKNSYENEKRRGISYIISEASVSTNPLIVGNSSHHQSFEQNLPLFIPMRRVYFAETLQKVPSKLHVCTWKIGCNNKILCPIQVFYHNKIEYYICEWRFLWLWKINWFFHII